MPSMPQQVATEQYSPAPQSRLDVHGVAPSQAMSVKHWLPDSVVAKQPQLPNAPPVPHS